MITKEANGTVGPSNTSCLQGYSVPGMVQAWRKQAPATVRLLAQIARELPSVCV
jgi:hypothetical protein